jgi:propionate CoA-transferase
LARNVISAEEAVKLIRDGDTIATSGFGGYGQPEDMCYHIGEAFKSTGHPRGLTLVHSSGQCNFVGERGIGNLAQEGLLKRTIGGHWRTSAAMVKLATEGKIEAYNLPQGIISHLYRDIAAGKPGTISHVGLKTFADPRLEGGKLNSITKEDIVQLLEINGREWLLYKAFPINVSIIRATTADAAGNLTVEKEGAYMELLAMTQAAKNSGGIVIAQVERVIDEMHPNAWLVKVPGILVDAIVVADPSRHWLNFGADFDPNFVGQRVSATEAMHPFPMSERKIVCRRAAMEIKHKSIINLGVGMPDGIATVAHEEGIGGEMTLTVEAGAFGGVPGKDFYFGGAMNPDMFIDQSAMFDFYDGGGLDLAFLGFGQIDSQGDVNASKFSSQIAGAGGFINISQNSKELVFCGTFTAGGLKLGTSDGTLRILNEGAHRKFVKELEQVTFSGEYARKHGQNVMYVTERAVFKLGPNGLTLIEIAPGVDLEKDVLALMDFKPEVAKNLKLMDSRIFQDELMGLSKQVVD